MDPNLLKLWTSRTGLKELARALPHRTRSPSSTKAMTAQSEAWARQWKRCIIPSAPCQCLNSEICKILKRPGLRTSWKKLTRRSKSSTTASVKLPAENGIFRPVVQGLVAQRRPNPHPAPQPSSPPPHLPPLARRHVLVIKYKAPVSPAHCHLVSPTQGIKARLATKQMDPLAVVHDSTPQLLKRPRVSTVRSSSMKKSYFQTVHRILHLLLPKERPRTVTRCHSPSCTFKTRVPRTTVLRRWTLLPSAPKLAFNIYTRPSSKDARKTMDGRTMILNGPLKVASLELGAAYSLFQGTKLCRPFVDMVSWRTWGPISTFLFLIYFFHYLVICIRSLFFLKFSKRIGILFLLYVLRIMIMIINTTVYNIRYTLKTFI